MPARAEAVRRQRVRIIGGVRRRLLLDFPDLPGLRPTPDRVRETLFNWLGQRLEGWRCLDLFAGSGALGFEAASRGAAEVVLVERDARAVDNLRRNAERLALPGITVRAQDALAYLCGDCGTFDLIFIDPPFASDLAASALARAATRLKPAGRIYVEYGDRLDTTGFTVLREGRAGRSHFCLLEMP